MPSIEILLATYNGARWLAEQLESIAGQTRTDWMVTARDDGSTDATREMLQAWSERHPGRLRILEDGRGRLGAAQSFSALLQDSSGSRIAFCDQDDVWAADRLEATARALEALETAHGAGTPLLAHSDLAVVGERLELRAASFWSHHVLDPGDDAVLRRLLVRNVVTGSTALLNRPLADLCAPVPGDAVMHDWWVALVAAALGKVAHVPARTVLYRQHGANRIGVAGVGARSAVRLLAKRERVASYYRRTRVQARAFLARYAERLSAADRATLEAYCALEQESAPLRGLRQLRSGFADSGLLRNAALAAFG
jgi:glycosyltransferase involved in cell wall biosynthesis